MEPVVFNQEEMQLLVERALASRPKFEDKRKQEVWEGILKKINGG